MSQNTKVLSVYMLCTAGLALTFLLGTQVYERFASAQATTELVEQFVYGTNCSNVRSYGGSTWEQYLYQVCTGPKLQPICYPTMYPPADLSNPGGLLIYFHGYSACPSSAIPYAEYMSSQHNFYVYNFLFPGHGRLYNDCVIPSECADGYPTESLPVTKQAYIDMVKQAVSIVRAEVQRLNLTGKTIAVSGLSHGGAAAAYAAAISGGLFTHQLSINAFYGISDVGVDDLQYKCQAEGTATDTCVLSALNATLQTFGVNVSAAEAAADITNVAVQTFLSQATAVELGFYEKWALVMNIVRNQLGLLIENRNLLPANLTSFMDGNWGWGDFCVLSMEKAGRGGMCSFKIKNMLAAHSFAQYALAQTRVSVKSTNVQYMTVERDGPTRLSLEWQGAQAADRNGAPVHMCMFRIATGCTEFDDDLCGVPHSCMDPADEILHPPYNIYWQPFIFTQSSAFLINKQSSIGVASFNGTNTAQCVSTSLYTPNPLLVGYILRGGILQLADNGFVATGAMDTLIFGSLVSSLAQPAWAVSSIRLETGNSQNKFLVEVPDYVEPVLIEMITNGSMSSLSLVPVVGYYQESSQKTFTPPAMTEIS
jgi:hypothetical protein